MTEENDIDRFLKAQESPFCGYEIALREISRGRKTSHWIWYIFPQLRCLGRSSTAHYYGIADRAEAIRFLAHPVLGARIREITAAMLTHKGRSAESILGSIDAMKLCSSMTMLDCIAPGDIFAEVLEAFYDGGRCAVTLRMMQEQP